MTASILLFFSALLAPFVCLAQGETYGGRVEFAASELRRPINPFSLYKSRIRYFMAPSASSMIVTVEGHTYSLNMMDVTTEAIGEWQRALGNNLTFEQVAAQDAADLVVSRSDEQEAGHPFARSRAKSAIQRRTGELTYLTDGFQEAFNNNDFRRAYEAYIKNAETPERTINNVLNFLARLTAKHELGHVLGFAHPNPIQDETDSIDSSVNSTLGDFIVIPDFPNPGIPIMTGGSLNYARHLFESLGRQVLADDIYISEQERAALGVLYDATEHQCSCCPISVSLPLKHGIFMPRKGNPNDSYACPVVPYVPRVNPEIFSFLFD